MSYAADYSMIAAEAPADVRAQFIRRTYSHLAGAILAFVMLMAGLMRIPGIEQFAITMSQAWIVVMLLFMGVSFLANMWANSNTSVAMQYLGLGLYVVVMSVIFLPLLVRISMMKDCQYIFAQGGIMTLAVFGGLTAAVFMTGKDFSFLGPIVAIGSLIAICVIFAGAMFGFNLGLFFSFAMVALLSASILYQTSNVMYHYRTDQHVAASLGLFASFATLLFYILRIVMANRE